MRAVIKSKSKDGKDKQFIEIWNQRQRIKTYDAEGLDVHGKIITGFPFGNLAWSSDETVS